MGNNVSQGAGKWDDKWQLQQDIARSPKSATCAHNLLESLPHSVLKMDQQHLQHHSSIVAALFTCVLAA